MRPLDYIATHEERLESNIAEILGTTDYIIEIEEIDTLNKTMLINIEDVEIELFYEESDVVVLETGYNEELNNLIIEQFKEFGYNVNHE